MISRHIAPRVIDALDSSPAVALIGPRQVGKTTLALEIGQARRSVYLDLETASDRAKLDDPETYLGGHEDALVILDEVHRAPELFQALRGLIDRGRRRGRTAGRFLLLGSASVDLLRQSGETLAGRIAYLELGPFDALEVPTADLDRLWARRFSFKLPRGQRSAQLQVAAGLHSDLSGARHSPVRRADSGGDAAAALDHARPQSRRVAERGESGPRARRRRQDHRPLS